MFTIATVQCTQCLNSHVRSVSSCGPISFLVRRGTVQSLKNVLNRAARTKPIPEEEKGAPFTGTVGPSG